MVKLNPKATRRRLRRHQLQLPQVLLLASRLSGATAGFPVPDTTSLKT